MVTPVQSLLLLLYPLFNKLFKDFRNIGLLLDVQLCNVATPSYVEPSIRPDDSRYGENPNRLQRHTQFQVILKPDPGNSQDLFIRSLSALGVDVNDHDIRFVEDNWESPVLGAWGLGWEVWMDGMEVTQFTYFQQAGGLQLMPVSVEITYGLERILMLLQGVDHFKKIQYADGITYGELFAENEKEMSAYYLEHATVDQIQKHFDLFEEEARHLLKLGLPIPAYDQLLKTSHAFNILDSRGFVGVTERARYFGRMRSLARQCAQLWLKTRESLGHPLGVVTELGPLTCSREVLKAALEKVSVEPRMFILEIGTEELPSHDVAYATEQLKDLIVQLLAKQRLSHLEVQAFGTPRRLVVCIDGLCANQVETEIEVRGPPVSKAFDDQGNPTKAIEGFCRRYNISLDSIYEKVDGKTQYVYACVIEPSRCALEVLAEDLPSTISKLSFPKSMRWNSQVLFSRPIRWIMALHGDAIVPFTFAGVFSGNLSYGLRNTPFATVKVESAESYAAVMEKAGISVGIEERKKLISENATALAESVNGHVIMPSGLLDEVVNLIEAPSPILGKFDKSFLMLPKDLLTMVMQKHQKYFGIADNSGRLLPYFIAVANGDIDVGVVRKGNEAVLRARYEDAKFFYETDTRKKFSEFRGQLNGILFQEKLGTMLDKMTRVEAIVPKLASYLGFDSELLQTIHEAASLAMSDLSTAVVTEFTSLAGIMARHYALRDGYSEQIADALFEITLPRNSGDILPKSDAGNVLAIADRLDSLVGLFGAGCQPTSTNDPFGLRRISYGLVQLLVENNKDLDLRNSLELAAEVQPFKVDSSTLDDAQQFVTRRLEQYLVDKGINPEVVRSVLLERANRPCLAAKSAVKMEALFYKDLLPRVIEAYSRPTRIVRGKDLDVNLEVNEGAFEMMEEKVLWNAFLSVSKRIHHDIEIDDFVEASSELVQPLADFFDNVFVMVEDERVRNNRLALLNKIADLPKGIADLSALPGF
ncbi:glycine--tRNA ligase, chloroplastic/mitochondrial 2 isoform X2 [Amaranthus tricolor]|uniref:glycine--tRNA ligase, chloroplastic/mitochondrial 2 isoform X2 n=1 Tax=Amaranthus tricolor TaxID=29722 RepID=UPI00258CD8A6|nr:glycine--tRNA ligase, chloroplastic/mitochondrial 2 isoform X2 [Amaranthus tricolor]